MDLTAVFSDVCWLKLNLTQHRHCSQTNGIRVIKSIYVCGRVIVTIYEHFAGEGFVKSSGVPRNFVRGRGGSTNSVEDRENVDLGGGSPLVRGSGGSCNLVQEISFHILKFS